MPPLRAAGHVNCWGSWIASRSVAHQDPRSLKVCGGVWACGEGCAVGHSREACSQPNNTKGLAESLLGLDIALANDFFENGHVDVTQPVDIEATFTGLVLAQFTQRFSEEGVEAGHKIQRQILLAWGKGSQRPVALLGAALRLVVVFPEPDHARAPHSRFLAGHALVHIQ